VKLTWLQLAAAFGALQGLFLTGALFAQRANRTANALLATLMLTFTVFLAGTVYYSLDLIRVYPHFFGVSYFGPWVFGPLVYLYAVAASDRSWRFHRRQLLHFIPLAVTLIAFAPTFALSGPEKVARYEFIRTHGLDGFIGWIDPLKYVSGISYSLATVLYIRRHRRDIENSYSNPEHVNLAWLIWIAGAAAFIWGMAVWLKLGGVTTRLRDEHISLGIAVLIYSIGYMGLRQPEIFRYETAEYPIPVLVPDPAAAQPALESQPIDDPSPAARYEKSGLTPREAERIRDSLLAVMEREHPWKNSELTLTDLAQQLDTTPHKLSAVLNSQLGQTFYDFVNGYRVREVQRRIAAGEGKELKMLALALDAGFASKSTFNQVFKKHTSQTPSDFVRQRVSA